MLKVILLIVSFLIGSVPFGYIVSRAVKKIDIRRFGSGNVGATNVVRVVGKGWGGFVFFLDFLKGFAVPFLAYFAGEPVPYFPIILGVVAISGHNWTPFLKFRGGKGVATSFGVLLALCFSFESLWLILLFSLGVWLILLLLFRIVSLASILAGFSFMILSLFLSPSKEIEILGIVLFLFILIRHKKNIKKICVGTESKF